jgi:hypothetical protein
MHANQYDHEHDGGSKKTELRLITQVDHHKIVSFFIFSKKVVKI